MGAVKNLLKEESGQGMAEYGLILAGVAVVVAAVIWGLGDKIKNLIEGLSFTKS